MVNFVRAKHHQKSRYKKIKILGQISGSLERPSVFKTLNISIFDVAWRHTKFPLNLLQFIPFLIFLTYFILELGRYWEI